ncbi:hypothetical protein ACFL96_17010 [Thermoproteota archaeon]
MTEQNIYLAAKSLLVFFALMSLYGSLRPKSVVGFTIEWFKWMKKFYGLEGGVWAGKDAIAICRVGNLLGLAISLLFLIFILKNP